MTWQITTPENVAAEDDPRFGDDYNRWQEILRGFSARWQQAARHSHSNRGVVLWDDGSVSLYTQNRNGAFSSRRHQ